MNYKKLEEFHSCLHREGLLALVSSYKSLSGTILFFSGAHRDASKYSFFSLFPVETIEIKNNCIFHTILGQQSTFPIDSCNPWDLLEKHFNPISENNLLDWVGFFGYEMGATSDVSLNFERKAAVTSDLYFQRSNILVKVDHEKEWIEIFVRHSDSEVERFLECVKKCFTEVVSCKAELKSKSVQFLSASDDEHTFAEKVLRAKELILAGEIYQLNLSQEMQFEGELDPFSFFCNLSHKNPTPFSAYLNLAEFAIISASPERFLKKEGKQLETRPIKGTRPRGKTADEDSFYKKQLLASPKERAELAMITDLMRNDLGQVSKIGSVVVKELFRCEEYANVFHLLSIIQSEAKNLSSWQILRACFPGGSITGCPKLRAMKFIQELEERPRGVYTGSIGYFCENGDFDFNVAIRTVIISQSKIYVALGSGIVADSDPQKEYEETLHKGRTIFQGMLCDGFI